MKNELHETTKKPILYIHIGAAKTGSSALQTCLAENRQFLMQKNKVSYSDYLESESFPIYWVNKHLNFYVSIVQEYLNTKSIHADQYSYLFYHGEPAADIVQRMKHTFFENNCNALIISCEELFPAVVKHLPSDATENPKYSLFEVRNYIISYFKYAFEEFEIKIVCYLRRQDDFMESFYYQHCKAAANEAMYKIFFVDSDETVKSKCDISWGRTQSSEFVTHFKNYNFHIEYYDALSYWAQVYGKENIIVRPYEKNQLPKGIEYDFLVNVLGLDDSLMKGLELNKQINVSVKKDIMEFKMASKRLGFNNYYQLMNNSSALEYLNANNKKNILSAEHARLLMAYYAKDNEKIAREYLHREDGILFHSKPREEKDDYPGLSLQAALDISRELALMLHNANDEKQGRIDALESENHAMRGDIGGLKENIAEAEAVRQTLEAEISDLRAAQ